MFEVSSFKEAGTIASEIMKRNTNGMMMHLAGVSTLYHMIKNGHSELLFKSSSNGLFN